MQACSIQARGGGGGCHIHTSVTTTSLFAPQIVVPAQFVAEQETKIIKNVWRVHWHKLLLATNWRNTHPTCYDADDKICREIRTLLHDLSSLHRLSTLFVESAPPPPLLPGSQDLLDFKYNGTSF